MSRMEQVLHTVGCIGLLIDFSFYFELTLNAAHPCLSPPPLRCRQAAASARCQHQHSFCRVQGVCPDAGLLQGTPRDGPIPPGGRSRPGAQDGRDAHCSHGGVNGGWGRGGAFGMGVLAGGVCISSVSLTVNRKYFVTGFLCIIASSVLFG